MFEGVVLSILERVLGEYVEGLDRDKLKVAVWSGQVSLTQLTLKREACYALGLPLAVKAGYLEKVELTIPWAKLGSEPVVLVLDGLYLVAGPLDEGEEGLDTASGEWAWSRKRGRLQREWQSAQLKTAELQDEAAEAEAEGKTGGRLSLLTKIIYNLQLSFKHIHCLLGIGFHRSKLPT